MPDIDTDFDDEGRQKVIDYVVQKYGKQPGSADHHLWHDGCQNEYQGRGPCNGPSAGGIQYASPKWFRINRASSWIVSSTPLSRGREKPAPIRKASPVKIIENVKKLRELIKGTDLQGGSAPRSLRAGRLRAQHRYPRGRYHHCARRTLYDLIPVSTAKDSDLLVTQFEGSIIESRRCNQDGLLGVENPYHHQRRLELIRQKPRHLHRNR